MNYQPQQFWIYDEGSVQNPFGRSKEIPSLCRGYAKFVTKMMPRIFSFCPHLLKLAHPNDLKVSKLLRYDNSKVDPVDHIMTFQNKPSLHKSNDADYDNYFFRLFLCTFNRDALNMLVELLPRYIFSWYVKAPYPFLPLILI